MYIQSELHPTAAGENGISMSKLRRLCHAQRHASSLRGNEKLFTWDLAVLNCATSQCHSKASEINEREDVHCDARQHGCLKLIFSSIFNI